MKKLMFLAPIFVMLFVLTGCTHEPINQKISFTSAETSSQYCISGWSFPEPDGTWSEGDSSSLLFKLPNSPDTDLNISIEARAFVFEKIPEQNIDVSLGDQFLTTLKYTMTDNAGIKQFVIPKSLIKKNNLQISLNFNYKNAKTPTEFGYSPDVRKLALKITSIEIKQVEQIK